MSFRLVYLPQTGSSTQVEVRRMATESKETSPIAVYTFSQRSGRGQAGNIWFCGEGRNIAATIAFDPVFLPAEHLFLLDMALSLAVLRYARGIHPDFMMKWPNDIYWNGRKFGGILIESQIQGGYVQRLYFGIGLNINESDFPEEIPNPVSAFLIDREERDLHGEMQRLVQYLDEAYVHFRQRFEKNPPQTVFAGLKCEYMNSLFLYKQWHSFCYRGDRIRARIYDVDEYGYLLLQQSDGTSIRCDIKELQYLFAG